ncbi:MAG: hypothetical protein IKA22_09635 [Lentisphaeria bacterium]|nr:hypothetical protein [Lentisphaeria bacterium]
MKNLIPASRFNKQSDRSIAIELLQSIPADLLWLLQNLVELSNAPSCFLGRKKFLLE